MNGNGRSSETAAAAEPRTDTPGLHLAVQQVGVPPAFRLVGRAARPGGTVVEAGGDDRVGKDLRLARKIGLRGRKPLVVFAAQAITRFPQKWYVS